MAYLREQLREVSLLAACAALLATVGCTQPSGPTDTQVQQQAASDAGRLHQDLKQAGAEAKVALDQARRETKDAIAGAREGWDQNSGKGSGRVDINHASAASLEMLPGIHPETARAIIAGRPYGSAHQLETRGIVSSEEYARISGVVVAH